MRSNRFEVDGLFVAEALPDDGEGAAELDAMRPPLLLVHGAGHGAWCWDKWMTVLAGQGWHSYALSLRNHPGSHAVDDATFRTRLGVADYAADVARVAAHIGRPCIVAGHSMGGIVVQRYLADRFAAGAREAGMILAASVPPGAFAPLREAPLPTDVAYHDPPEEARDRYFRSRDEAVWGEAVAALVPESPSVMNEYSLDGGVPIAADAIGCPGLVISAGYDRSVVPRDDCIARYYGVDYLAAPEIGHDLMLDEGWQDVLAEVEGWLRKTYLAS